jgi:hypothetical protein
MSDASTISTVGHYCGRFASGFFGEPLNSFSNLAFVFGAFYAWHVWRSNVNRDRWQLILFILSAGIGFGSFIFHSAPTPNTLLADLVPIQIFALAFLGYVALKYLRLSSKAVVVILILFLVGRQSWVALVPPGALGGGITHVPALFLLVAITFVLRRKGLLLWRYLACASVAYSAALLVRSWDLAVCSYFPWGLHWAWHILTALTASILVLGIAAKPNARHLMI